METSFEDEIHPTVIALSSAGHFFKSMMYKYDILPKSYTLSRFPMRWQDLKPVAAWTRVSQLRNTTDLRFLTRSHSIYRFSPDRRAQTLFVTRCQDRRNEKARACADDFMMLPWQLLVRIDTDKGQADGLKPTTLHQLTNKDSGILEAKKFLIMRNANVEKRTSCSTVIVIKWRNVSTVCPGWI